MMDETEPCSHQVVVQLTRGAWWQHGALYCRTPEHTFDSAANPADAEGFPSFRQISGRNRNRAGQTPASPHLGAVPLRYSRDRRAPPFLVSCATHLPILLLRAGDSDPFSRCLKY